jgi:hypothetical protein
MLLPEVRFEGYSGHGQNRQPRQIMTLAVSRPRPEAGYTYTLEQYRSERIDPSVVTQLIRCIQRCLYPKSLR